MKALVFQILTLMFFLEARAFAATPDLAAVQAADLRSGREITVSGVGKKGLVVVFLSAQCPCSNSHVRELAALAGEYPEFSFVGVHANGGEDKRETVSYFERVHLPFPVVRDANYTLADRYKAFKTPHSFVIQSDGRIAYRGGVSSSHSFENADHKFLREALEDLRQNRAVRTPEGRTLGCAIARGERNVW